MQEIGRTGLKGSAIVLGCMRMNALEVQEAQQTLATAWDLGINMFDHADIYGDGESERRFQQAYKALGLPRDQMIVQSKCGIRQGYFDFSKDYLIASVDGILQRLKTDYLDVLLLHRPDILIQPEEVAEAFDRLKESGKVRHFGVSNQNPMQMQLLEHYLTNPLTVNQMQLSPAHTPMFDAALNVNMRNQAAVDRDNGVIDYCRYKQITIQAWSPFQIDLQKGLFMGNPDYDELNTTIHDLAKNYGVSDEAIVTAWLLRHPANMQVIVGSMNPERLHRIAQASEVHLSRQEWYKIYTSAGNQLP